MQLFKIFQKVLSNTHMTVFSLNPFLFFNFWNSYHFIFIQLETVIISLVGEPREYSHLFQGLLGQFLNCAIIAVIFTTCKESLLKATFIKNVRFKLWYTLYVIAWSIVHLTHPVETIQSQVVTHRTLSVLLWVHIYTLRWTLGLLYKSNGDRNILKLMKLIHFMGVAHSVNLER